MSALTHAVAQLSLSHFPRRRAASASDASSSGGGSGSSSGGFLSRSAIPSITRRGAPLSPSDTISSVTLDKVTASVGECVQVKFDILASCEPHDWIGLYLADGSGADAYIDHRRRGKITSTSGTVSWVLEPWLFTAYATSSIKVHFCYYSKDGMLQVASSRLTVNLNNSSQTLEAPMSPNCRNPFTDETSFITVSGMFARDLKKKKLGRPDPFLRLHIIPGKSYPWQTHHEQTARTHRCKSTCSPAWTGEVFRFHVLGSDVLEFVISTKATGDGGFLGKATVNMQRYVGVEKGSDLLLSLDRQGPGDAVSGVVCAYIEWSRTCKPPVFAAGQDPIASMMLAGTASMHSQFPDSMATQSGSLAPGTTSGNASAALPDDIYYVPGQAQLQGFEADCRRHSYSGQSSASSSVPGQRLRQADDMYFVPGQLGSVSRSTRESIASAVSEPEAQQDPDDIYHVPSCLKHQGRSSPPVSASLSPRCISPLPDIPKEDAVNFVQEEDVYFVPDSALVTAIKAANLNSSSTAQKRDSPPTAKEESEECDMYHVSGTGRPGSLSAFALMDIQASVANLASMETSGSTSGPQGDTKDSYDYGNAVVPPSRNSGSDIGDDEGENVYFQADNSPPGSKPPGSAAGNADKKSLQNGGGGFNDQGLYECVPSASQSNSGSDFADSLCDITNIEVSTGTRSAPSTPPRLPVSRSLISVGSTTSAPLSPRSSCHSFSASNAKVALAALPGRLSKLLARKTDSGSRQESVDTLRQSTSVTTVHKPWSMLDSIDTICAEDNDIYSVASSPLNLTDIEDPEPLRGRAAKDCKRDIKRNKPVTKLSPWRRSSPSPCRPAPSSPLTKPQARRAQTPLGVAQAPTDEDTRPSVCSTVSTVSITSDMLEYAEGCRSALPSDVEMLMQCDSPPLPTPAGPAPTSSNEDAGSVYDTYECGSVCRISATRPTPPASSDELAADDIAIEPRLSSHSLDDAASVSGASIVSELDDGVYGHVE